jgi:hypothetical protein
MIAQTIRLSIWQGLFVDRLLSCMLRCICTRVPAFDCPCHLWIYISPRQRQALVTLLLRLQESSINEVIGFFKKWICIMLVARSNRARDGGLARPHKPILFTFLAPTMNKDPDSGGKPRHRRSNPFCLSRSCREWIP